MPVDLNPELTAEQAGRVLAVCVGPSEIASDRNSVEVTRKFVQLTYPGWLRNLSRQASVT